MNNDYATLSHLSLSDSATLAHPDSLPEIVHLDSPALHAFTDFRYRMPVTVEPELGIDDALQKMKWSGVRLLLVMRNGQLIGLITSRDIEGEKPVTLARDTGIRHDDIRVQQVMTRCADAPVLNMLSVRGAQVGHIVATLRELECKHLLVVSVDDSTGVQHVAGLFSSSQLAQQLGDRVSDAMVASHSLAEMVVGGR